MIEQANTPSPVDAALMALGEELSPHEQEQLVGDMLAETAGANAEQMAYEGTEDPDAWVAAYMTRRMAELDENDRLLKEFVARETKRRGYIRKGLTYKWGPTLQAYINRVRGKKQSIDTPHGRTGYRKQPQRATLVIDDESVAVNHAAEICPDAIKIARTILKSEVPEGVVLRGTHLDTKPESNMFFIGKYKVNPAKADDQPALEHTSRADAEQFLSRADEINFDEVPQ